MFQTDDVTVVLRVEHEARRDTVSVNGIVVPRLGDTSPLWGGEVRLVALAVPGGPGGRGGPGGPGGDARAERVDAQGGFVLDGVPPGSYHLELRSGDEVVVVEDLQIDAASAGQPRPEGS
jgi:hypothetical protein